MTGWICRKHEKIEKVTGSRDDAFVVSWRCKKGVFSDFYCLPVKLALVGRSPGLSSAVPAGLDFVMVVLPQTLKALLSSRED
jgi:hypothetical protein